MIGIAAGLDAGAFGTSTYKTRNDYQKTFTKIILNDKKGYGITDDDVKEIYWTPYNSFFLTKDNELYTQGNYPIGYLDNTHTSLTDEEKYTLLKIDDNVDKVFPCLQISNEEIIYLKKDKTLWHSGYLYNIGTKFNPKKNSLTYTKQQLSIDNDYIFDNIKDIQITAYKLFILKNDGNLYISGRNIRAWTQKNGSYCYNNYSVGYGIKMCEDNVSTSDANKYIASGTPETFIKLFDNIDRMFICNDNSWLITKDKKLLYCGQFSPDFELSDKEHSFNNDKYYNKPCIDEFIEFPLPIADEITSTDDILKIMSTYCNTIILTRDKKVFYEGNNNANWQTLGSKDIPDTTKFSKYPLDLKIKNMKLEETILCVETEDNKVLLTTSNGYYNAGNNTSTKVSEFIDITDNLKTNLENEEYILKKKIVAHQISLFNYDKYITPNITCINKKNILDITVTNQQEYNIDDVSICFQVNDTNNIIDYWDIIVLNKINFDVAYNKFINILNEGSNKIKMYISDDLSNETHKSNILDLKIYKILDKAIAYNKKAKIKEILFKQKRPINFLTDNGEYSQIIYNIGNGEKIYDNEEIISDKINISFLANKEDKIKSYKIYQGFNKLDIKLKDLIPFEKNA